MDLSTPWGGEGPISQEKDLISSVNDNAVNKLIASLSAVRGISLSQTLFCESFEVCFLGQK